MNRFDEQLEILVKAALVEDIGSGDHSTLSCIPANKQGKAVLKIKQSGILAGVAVAEKIFRIQDPHAIFTTFKQDGDSMEAGEVAFDVSTS
ncbi:MAG: nicotinate-nucleotide diphosphorylase (carboxylating), partial [Sediminibacterium sp.]